MYQFRKLISLWFMVGAGLSAVIAVAMLVVVTGFIIQQGASYITPSFFLEVPKPVGQPGGGVANAIIGTGMLVLIACLMGLPVGIGAGMYLAEFAGRGIGNFIRFLADVLTGVPSIIVGVFAYAVVVLRFGFSAYAGGFALAIIMLPIVARTTEEMLKLVPFSQREAALGLGVSRWRTTFSVIVPSALPGIVTGVLLATARIAGETAPLLFTAFGNPFMSLDPSGPVAALPTQIYRFGISPYIEWHQQAWAASFVLLCLVLILSAGARILVARRS